ncbi:hypothetical protein [Paenibacillus mucilaginosus]|uniref:Uncharacterized protein n=2 Tax=Paenibacillus mucilaginosus TaxID=61624 RepID=H6NEH1_9BACL|nr:hypothetical protein [Paenibacillus mucilaginosus]AEI42330.1 hypothetical protein KNP414_03791 [Paenibacillus mucilaginosus KNP414]AFC28114.1 hypothetical protein PM3016_1184 [Paenibacillus mucilaginosus 3016]MCG7214286.1 hypothetical protein [Paenibacillus mucilaginosus]WDM28795.1 hypothetical protein KCX80_06180 [Paenibacillus mucilaginosus]WFA16958.1 hypothetical protein ERY13_06215 [Paenibacillus mucilaginosus]
MHINKRLITLLLILFFLTNVVTFGLLYFSRLDTTFSISTTSRKGEHTVKVQTFSGQSPTWKVDHYTVVRTENKLWRGGAKLTHVGDPEERAAGTSYFKYTFYEQKEDKQQADVVLAGSTSGPPGSTPFQDLRKLGATEETPFGKWAPIRSVYLEVEWFDPSGEMRKDKIFLSE